MGPRDGGRREKGRGLRRVRKHYVAVLLRRNGNVIIITENIDQ